MPKKKKTPTRKSVETHSHIFSLVKDYDISAEAGINSTLLNAEYAWTDESNDPVYVFTTQVILRGECLAPKERGGDLIEISISGDDRPSRNLGVKLSDAQERDEHRAPKYRSYRGREIPVYRKVPGLGLLDKVRGEKSWTAWLHASTAFVSQLSIILGQNKKTWLAIHEVKDGRSRWVRSISLQTTDPAEE